MLVGIYLVLKEKSGVRIESRVGFDTNFASDKNLNVPSKFKIYKAPTLHFLY